MGLNKHICNAQSTSRQAIFLFVGQAGCQIGSSLWRLLNEEHGILPDGSVMPSDKGLCQNSNFNSCNENHRNFSYFEWKHVEKFVPRNLFIDLEPMVIDEIMTGAFKNLFCNDLNYYQFSKMGDASNIFPRGYNTVGRYILTNIMNSIRHLAEKTDRLSVFNISRSYGGGTGSGVGSLLLENLHENYPKIILCETNILNSDCLDSPTLEPYNNLFGMESSSSCSHITLVYNNKKLEHLCSKNLSIERPYFATINQLLSYSVSGIYSTERFPGYGSCNLSSIITNLVPIPRIQFSVCSLAPVVGKEVIKYERFSKPSDLTDTVISNNNLMFDIDLESGPYVSCCMIYRGLVSPAHIAQNHQSLLKNKKFKFSEWNPGSIKNGHSPIGLISLSNFNLGSSQLSMLMLANHTGINNAFSKEYKSVNTMMKKDAFIHWFRDHGMEKEDFMSALENLVLLSLDYKNIENYPGQEDGDKSKSKDEEIKMMISEMLTSRPFSKKGGMDADNEDTLGRSDRGSKYYDDYEYDEFGNKIYKDDDGDEYDSHGNKINKKIPKITVCQSLQTFRNLEKLKSASKGSGSENKSPSRRKRCQSVNIFTESIRPKLSKVTVKHQQTRCCLSLLKRYQESFVQGIFPKTNINYLNYTSRSPDVAQSTQPIVFNV